jgi:hypothetical protein
MAANWKKLLQAGDACGSPLTTGTQTISGAKTFSTLVKIDGGSANWDETTPGTSAGSIHLDPGVTTDHYGSAITFGASDTGDGETAQAGIYVRSDGGYGTKMYFATTDNYGAGSTTALSLSSDQSVVIAGATTIQGTLSTGTDGAYGQNFFRGQTNFLVDADSTLSINNQGGNATGITAGAGDSLYLGANNAGGAIAINTSQQVTFNQDATFGGSIANTGLHTVTQAADDDGIRFRGYDDVNSYYGKIGLDDNGYLQIFSEVNRSIKIKSGRQIQFFTSEDNSTYVNSVNFNDDGSATFTGTVTGTTFIGALTGNASGSSATCSGLAGSATVLATPRTIAGNSFDGSAIITIDIEDLDNVTVSDSAANGSPSTGDIWIEY